MSVTPPTSQRSDTSSRPDVLLLQRIKTRLADLEELLREVSSHWGYEDPIYRFYHQSFKVYHLQAATERIVGVLRDLAGDRPLNAWFLEIIAAGTGKRFTAEANKKWTAETRSILEASFHARYFLEMVCKYGRELELAEPEGAAGHEYAVVSPLTAEFRLDGAALRTDTPVDAVDQLSEER